MHNTWLGSEEAFTAHLERYRQMIASHGSLDMLRHVVSPKKSGAAKLQAGDGEDEDELYPNPVAYQVVGNVAVLTISGGTENKTTWLTRYCSVPTYDDVRERMIEAYEDQTVKSVMLNLATPGGYAEGAFGLAEFISAYTKNVKPVVSYTDSSVASAGVLYGTAASALFADKYAMAGSVGAVILFMDMSGYFADLKIKPYVFRSAPYKAVPNMYEGMTKIGEEVLNERVTMWHERFVEQLSLNTGLDAKTISAGIANGKMFTAQEAVTLKLVQGITTFDKLVATMNTKYQNINVSAARPN